MDLDAATCSLRSRWRAVVGDLEREPKIVGHLRAEARGILLGGALVTETAGMNQRVAFRAMQTHQTQAMSNPCTGRRAQRTDAGM